MTNPHTIPSRRGWLVAAGAMLFSACCPAAMAQAKKSTIGKFDAAAALNKAIRQPMLAERITKSFTLVGQKVLETRSKRQLEDAVKEFEAALKDLQTSAPTADIKDNYQLLEQLFDEYKSITSKPVSLTNAKLLAEQNEELVWISTKGAMLLQAHTKSMRSDLIITAGDLRTLTQRIAKLYLFRSWGIRSDVIANDLKKADADYRADMAKLLAAPHNTAQINSELALAETQYLFLKQAIDRLNASKTSTVELEHVTKACDNILDVMERVTKLYEAVKA
ncbi:MAG: type IV pili methyl-accepting chemotaxis transducer N-terminal domain-containing protein [Betaproteobacteria bacterium]